MAGVDKVPGMRKNGPPVIEEDEIDKLSGQELIDALNAEIGNWNQSGMHPSAVDHDFFAMDVQLGTVVQTMIDLELIDVDDFNDRYRRRFLRKLTTIRSDTVKQRITAGVPGVGDSGIVIAR